MKDFLVPDLGEGLEDATITSWNVAVGDDVELNQTLCTVETNKAEVEIPSPYAGRIVELGGGEGDTLNVGSVLVRVATESAPTPRRMAWAPRAKRCWSGTAPMTTWTPADGAPSPATDRQPKAKPPVRKLAAELHVDLTDLAPSGPEGVITREDVLAAAGQSDEPEDTVSVRGVHAQMAQRMTLSRSQIPDAHASVHVDCSGLLQLRDRLRDAAGDDGPPITPFARRCACSPSR